ncbi:MAG: acyltransferase [Clostridia bacterium]|nr:acyltransferase [Clostridia bacterium]
MIKVTESAMLASLEDGNRFIGETPEMVNSSITFSGKNNVLFCEKRVKLNNTVINFNADNAIVYLCENNNEYKLNLNVYNDNVFYSGKNNYYNGVMNVILSEQKHLFIGNDCLLSFGIWIRNADPHLIYDAESHKRINPTKSIYIGDHVWIGQSAMILKGTQIESGSIIGAMSVVSNKKIGANSSWAGNPAKKIREGLFWNRPCVHKWTEEQTKDSRHFIRNTFIFKHKRSEYISFSEIEEKLDAKNSVDSKLKYLGKISADDSKNRFCAGSEKEENASGGFFSRFKK